MSSPCEPSALHLDGTYQNKRYRLKIDGRTIYIPGRPFKYLVVLACVRFQDHFGGGYLPKERIEVGANQARYLYRLRVDIQLALGNRQWGVFEPGHHRDGTYRLACDPGAISFNLPKLREFPDKELLNFLPAKELKIPLDSGIVK